MTRKQIAIIITMIIIIVSALYSCHKSLPSIEELSKKDLSFQEWQTLYDNIHIVIGSGDQEDFILQKMYQKANTYDEYRITYKKNYHKSTAQACLVQMLNLSNSYADAYYIFQRVISYPRYQRAPLEKMAEFANTTPEWKIIWKNTNFGNPLHTRAINEIAKLSKTKAS